MDRIKIEQLLNDTATTEGYRIADRIAAAQALATFHLADMLADVGPSIERLAEARV